MVPNMERKKLKLSLIENSHTFMSEAVAKAIQARSDINQWPFAILNLIQALELSLKELLRREHPILIYDKVDAPKNTVTISQALLRIQNEKILGIKIPTAERAKIAKAVNLRNKIIHFEFELTEEYAIVKFSEIFAFLVYFQGRFLEIEVEDILPDDRLESVIEIKKCFTELRDKAYQRIKDEDIPEDQIWGCPYCGEDTFVIWDARDVCFLCRQTCKVIECPHCGKFWFDHDMQDFSNLIDIDYSDATITICNDYGYSSLDACPECIGKIREDIEEKRANEFYDLMEKEEYYRKNRY